MSLSKKDMSSLRAAADATSHNLSPRATRAPYVLQCRPCGVSTTKTIETFSPPTSRGCPELLRRESD
jgi:hypothetical protein